jgi:hypothetical protein
MASAQIAFLALSLLAFAVLAPVASAAVSSDQICNEDITMVTGHAAGYDYGVGLDHGCHPVAYVH